MASVGRFKSAPLRTLVSGFVELCYNESKAFALKLMQIKRTVLVFLVIVNENDFY